jgi:hypothetical protein
VGLEGGFAVVEMECFEVFHANNTLKAFHTFVKGFR